MNKILYLVIALSKKKQKQTHRYIYLQFLEIYNKNQYYTRRFNRTYTHVHNQYKHTYKYFNI